MSNKNFATTKHPKTRVTSPKHRGWIGVDLDGTLAHYDHWRGFNHIGEPIIPMVSRVKAWLKEGKEVRIFTARVASPGEMDAGAKYIERWCKKHIGRALAITATKDYGMVELWDDRAVQVELNTGRRMDGVPDPEHWTP
jgi:hypothetical protein